MLPIALAERIRNCRSLPTLPGVALRIVELCSNDDVRVGDIAKAIQNDPALAARMLRFANSSRVGVRNPVTTLTMAVTLLGLLRVRTIALSFSLVSDIQRRGVDLRQGYWRRTLYSTAASRSLAAATRWEPMEEVVLGALLQDVGMLVLQQALGAEYSQILLDAGPEHAKLVELERERLGCDHGAVSSWLATEWQLPALFSETALTSHDGLLTNSLPPPSMAQRVVALSGLVADVWVGGEPALRAAAARRFASDCGISSQILQSVFDDMATSVQAVCELLDAPAETPEDFERLLDDARDNLVALSVRADEENWRLRETSERDPLTGLYNRRFLERALVRAMDEAAEQIKPLSVVFIDIDRFKSINDTYGHLVGDLVIRLVSDELRGCLRESDVSARYGGEEFVAVLSGTPAEGAAIVCERIRARIEGASLQASGTRVQVTVSIGVATVSGHGSTTSQRLLQSADDALLEAKRTGRNRVVSAPVMSSQPPGSMRENGLSRDP